MGIFNILSNSLIFIHSLVSCHMSPPVFHYISPPGRSEDALCCLSASECWEVPGSLPPAQQCQAGAAGQRQATCRGLWAHWERPHPAGSDCSGGQVVWSVVSKSREIYFFCGTSLRERTCKCSLNGVAIECIKNKHTPPGKVRLLRSSRNCPRKNKNCKRKNGEGQHSFSTACVQYTINAARHLSTLQAPGKSRRYHRVAPQGRHEGVGADWRQDGDGCSNLLCQQAFSPQHRDPGADHQTHGGAEPSRRPLWPEQDRPQAAGQLGQGRPLWVCVCLGIVSNIEMYTNVDVSLWVGGSYRSLSNRCFLLIQFVRWLCWLWAYYRWSHPVSSDEARHGGLQLGELQGDFPGNLSQLQRCALLSNGAAPESAGPKDGLSLPPARGAEADFDGFSSVVT